MRSKPEFRFKEQIEYRCINHLKKFHSGKKNAIPHKLLATRLGMNPRELRALISHLVREHYIPIGSLSKSDSGIFFILDKKVMEKAHEELMSRSGKIIDRAFALKQAFRKYYKNEKKPKLSLIYKDRRATSIGCTFSLLSIKKRDKNGKRIKRNKRRNSKPKNRKR